MAGPVTHSTAEWLVDRAKDSLKQDKFYEAKSWLLTAKTLYPRNFFIQHEAYNIERNARRVKEAADLFCEMFEQFPDESPLWKDIFHIIGALENDKPDVKGEFLKGNSGCYRKGRMRLKQEQPLRLIPCTESEVLSFCIRLLITCFKLRISQESRTSISNLFRHLIVLLQYDWPREETTFYEMLEKIRANGGLTYRSFFDYVVNIDMLEEFAHMNNEGILKLDFLPKSSSATRARTVTRGVNKGVKEDFRSAMEKQVMRSDESIEPLLKGF
ncbi:predicted protein, partial [Nematostella vectensis]